MADARLSRLNGWSIVIARAFLATSLLLESSVRVSHPTPRADLLFSLELLLGAAIAAGWLIRYAAALVLLDTVAAGVLAPYSHFALLPLNNKGTTVAVLIASGLLVCFGQYVDNIGTTLINETNKSTNEHSGTLLHDSRDHDGEVTIRLEQGLTRTLRRHRCIVTIHDRMGSRKTSQEAWYARDDH
jgi:hypothetical protein